MNLNDETIVGNNTINITDALNGAVLKLKLSLTANTVIPSTNDLVINVIQGNETQEYEFELSSTLKYLNNTSDEFIQYYEIVNNRIVMKTIVKRYIDNNTVLSTPTIEYLDNIPIILFENANQITTNYQNIGIEVIYPKNTEYNRIFLNNAVYYHNLNIEDRYYKDAFTKVNNELNLEVNNLSIDCLTSNNNNFSLDSEGNLTVNSINSAQTHISFDQIYPIGSIYMSISNVNPTILFGGTWEQITNKFLYATNNTPGNTGGSSTKTLVEANLPSHTHNIPALTGSTSETGSHNHHGLYWSGGQQISISSYGATVNGYVTGYSNAKANTSSIHTGSDGDHTHTITTNASATSSSGTGTAFDIMPPYLEVYIWKRVS